MSLVVHPSSTPSALFPLSDQVGQQFVAGTTVATLQERLLAGLELFENSWVSPDDYALLSAESDASLVSKDGELIAWVGQKDSKKLVSEGGSFIIRHAWDLLSVNEQVLGQLVESHHEGEVHVAANVDGILVTGPGTRILPGVYVEGTVVIGAGCKIGPNCYLRGSTTIGDHCHVGQSVEIKNSILGHGSSVGHLSYVGDSILDEKVNFGAGTTTSNLRHDNANHKTMINGALVDTGRRKFGTVVGAGVHTGIHTSLYPGRKIAAGQTTLPNQTVEADIV